MDIDNRHEYVNEIQIQGDVLDKQAEYLYKTAMNLWDEGKKDEYRLVMGVANMLFMFKEGTYTIREIRNFANTGVY